METQEYLYADRNEQVKRVNRVMIFTFLIYYLLLTVIVVICMLRGLRTVGFTVMTCVLEVATLAAFFTTYAKKPDSEKLRYYALVALAVIGFLGAYAFTSYYLRFALMGPLVTFILYYDKKFSRISSIVIAAVQLGSFLMRVIAGTYTMDETIDIGAAIGACFAVLILCVYLEGVLERFSDDTIGLIQSKADAQAEMMKEVLYVADEVRKGTDTAMTNMNELDDATSSVSGAMSDISDSTLATAEDIQNQTVMTQNIQDLIEETVARSEEMVAIATESGQINQENVSIMDELKTQSNTIADINEQVATSMAALGEKTEEVKGITDVILAISSQTNLLALNASIEAARAGEAGKGFAVVADEIRNLADQTKKATEDITSMIIGLGNNAQDASEAVMVARTASTLQGELIEKASSSFVKMNENVEHLTDDIAGVEEMVENLATANNQIVDNISHLSATTEEVTASSQQATGLSEQNKELAFKTKELLSNVQEAASKLDKYTV